MDSKQLSFFMTIGRVFLSESINPKPQVYVSYKLFWDGKVEVLRTSYEPAVTEKITNWQGLNEVIKQAAEKDSKRFAPPGKERIGRITEDPREVYYLEEYIK